MDDTRDRGRSQRRSVPLRVRQTVLESGPCAYCGDPEPTVVDHIVPWARAGGDGRANLAPACWTCNAEKGNWSPDEWREARLRLGGYWPPSPLARKAEDMVGHYLANEGVTVETSVRASMIEHARAIVGPFVNCYGCGERFAPNYGGATSTHCADCELWS